MKIRESRPSELDEVKEIIDAAEEMDTEESTYTIEYLDGLVDEHLVLVAVEDDGTEGVVGACFGKYDCKKDWADMVGLAVQSDYRGEGIGTTLVERFEQEVRSRDISTIDLFAEESRCSFFDNLGYEEGRTYVAFRKHVD